MPRNLALLLPIVLLVIVGVTFMLKRAYSPMATELDLLTPHATARKDHQPQRVLQTQIGEHDAQNQDKIASLPAKKETYLTSSEPVAPTPSGKNNAQPLPENEIRTLSERDQWEQEVSIEAQRTYSRIRELMVQRRPLWARILTIQNKQIELIQTDRLGMSDIEQDALSNEFEALSREFAELNARHDVLLSEQESLRDSFLPRYGITYQGAWSLYRSRQKVQDTDK